MKQIIVQKDILKDNKDVMKRNKEKLDKNKVFTINLLGSPGGGKTSLLEEIIKNMKSQINMSIIEGDLYTTKDARRIEKHNVDVIQLNTEGACHLHSSMIEEAINQIQLKDLDLLVIENIGNLICTASYDLGEDIKITVMSVTEGNDKPLKYPHIFQKSKAVILNKIDIIEHTNFDIDEFHKDIKSLNENIDILKTSCVTGEGIEDLCRYIQKNIKNKK